MCYGRISVFIVSGTIAFLCIGMPISYMIIFADAAVPLTSQIADSEIHPEFRILVILILGVLIAYYCIKREIYELRIISYASVTCSVLFTIVLTIIFISNYDTLDHSLFDHLYPESMTGFFQTAPTVFLAYCYQQIFMTIYKSLKEQTDSNGRKVALSSFIVCSVLYIIVTMLCFWIWGSSLKSDVLRNIGNSEFSLRYVCSVLFLVIAALHTPVIFFVGKEQALTFYCELRYSSISQHPHMNSMLSSTLDAKEYYTITVTLYLIVVFCACVIL